MTWQGFKLPVQVRVRIAEMPVPAVDSIRQSCTKCRSPVWTDRLTWESPLGKMGTVLCVQCMEELTKLS